LSIAISKLNDLTSASKYYPSSIEDLAKTVTTSDWSPFLFSDDYRHSESWEACTILGLDVDSGCTLEEAQKIFAPYMHVIVTTKSHQIDKHGIKCDRFRVVLFLSDFITDREVYKATWYDLAAKFPFIDKQCKDFARYFFKGVSIVSVKSEGDTITPSAARPLATLVASNKTETKVVVKGELSKSTLKFLLEGAPAGEWNITLFKAAKDAQEQGYTEAEFIEKAHKVTGILDANDLSSIASAFKNDPKYNPRNVRATYTVPNALIMKSNPAIRKLGDPVRGPNWMDCLEWVWRKKEVLGILAAPGTGKTAVTLKIFADFIRNNPDNQDIFIFFSLEMTAASILNRWEKLCGGDPTMYERLYVVANEDEENNPRHINLQKLYWYSLDTARTAGKSIGAIAIDHIGIINNTVDITQKPNFGVEGELDGNWGNIKSLSHATICSKMKELAKMLDCFVIVQSQTTKDKAGDGDTPISKGGAFGAAQFEWDVHYLVTLWQPLLRVHNETSLRVTAWQYCKVREQHADDKVTMFDARMLHFDQTNGDLRPLTSEEEEVFYGLINKANEIRAKVAQKKSVTYRNSPIVDIAKLKVITRPLWDRKGVPNGNA
jgi:hypothetical protein